MSAEGEKVQTNPQWLSRGLWLEGVAVAQAVQVLEARGRPVWILLAE